ncbi:hypothetical protein [Streptomyces griseorubiginosus]|uniref:hypothetical protein n=1 Tax=Streptomyces griseorubiginosus TaxID=67304 RepID=UPI000AC6A326|nr:hypothetical protein [Streptomyces griseorubiginosus]
MGELAGEVGGGQRAGEWIGATGCRNPVAAQGRTEQKGQAVGESSRHWDGPGLERKIRGAGRPWTVGDIAMVAEGQWAVGTQARRQRDGEAVVERRIADGRRVELTLVELAREMDSRFGAAHRDEDSR